MPDTDPDVPEPDATTLADLLYRCAEGDRERAAVELLADAPGNLLDRPDVRAVITLHLHEEPEGRVQVNGAHVNWYNLRQLLLDRAPSPATSALILALHLALDAANGLGVLLTYLGVDGMTAFVQAASRLAATPAGAR